MKERESNYDLLRICSAFAVVILHVSGGIVQYDEVKSPVNCAFFPILLNHIVRFAVPCFLMLSGAFILADERNADYKYFYKKAVRNIGITGAIFCMLYVFYGIAKLMLGVFVFNKHEIHYFLGELLAIINNLLKGQPFVHLWYLFTLIGLYLAAPFVIRLATDMRWGGVNLYGKIATVFLTLASVSYITSEHKLMWDIGWQFCYLSYLLMGYKLRQWGKSRKNNWTAILLIFVGTMVNVILACINYLRALEGLPVDAIQCYRNLFSYAPLAPIEILASCLVFAGFSMLKISRNFSKLSRYTFLIYLIHAGVIDVLFTIIGDRLNGNQYIEAASIMIISIVVFATSLLGAIIYNKFFDHFFDGNVD